MKQRLKFFLIFIYPYWSFLVLAFFLSSDDLNKGFILFIVLQLSMLIAALISSINLLRLTLKNKLNSRNLALRNFIYKLLHLPPYILLNIFLVARAGYQPSNMDSAANIAIIWTSILVLVTGLLGITSIIDFVKKKKRSKTMIGFLAILGLGQCIFVIDVFAALILLLITLITTRKGNKN